MDLSTRQGRREQGQLIQKAVERAGLSVEELANRIGCSRALIYQYLSGTTLAQPDRLQLIAKEVGLPLVSFYGGTSEEPPKSRPATETISPEARFTERIQQLNELAHAQEAPPEWDALASTCERIVTLAAQFEDQKTEAGALLRLGKARCRMGEFSRAIDSLQRAVNLFAVREDASRESDSRQTLGHALLALGRTTEARRQFEWVAQSGPIDKRWAGAVSLAGVYEQQGDYRLAMEKCDEAAAFLEEAVSPQDASRGMLYVNGNRINLYLACGDFTSAQELAEKCQEEAEVLGSSDQHLEARLNLGVCLLFQGRWARARKMLLSALQLARFVGDKSRESMARATLAILLAALCDCDNCIQHAKDALAASLLQGDHRTELFAQIALTDAYFSLGRDSEARYHANQALGVASALRLSLYEALSRLRIARLYLHSGDLEDVSEPVERALASARQLGARHLEAEALLLRGEWHRRTGMISEAEADASASLQITSERSLIPLQWEVLALRARIASVDPRRLEEAESAAGQAVLLIEALRAELREAGIADTLLEDRERQAVYLLRAGLMRALGRAGDAASFIDQAGWPPLMERFEADSVSESASEPVTEQVPEPENAEGQKVDDR